jgi:hypothetical protein
VICSRTLLTDVADSLSPGAIVGIAAAGAVVAALLLWRLWSSCKRRRDSSHARHPYASAVPSTDGGGSMAVQTSSVELDAVPESDARFAGTSQPRSPAGPASPVESRPAVSVRKFIENLDKYRAMQQEQLRQQQQKASRDRRAGGAARHTRRTWGNDGSKVALDDLESAAEMDDRDAFSVGDEENVADDDERGYDAEEEDDDNNVGNDLDHGGVRGSRPPNVALAGGQASVESLLAPARARWASDSAAAMAPFGKLSFPLVMSQTSLQTSGSGGGDWVSSEAIYANPVLPTSNPSSPPGSPPPAPAVGSLSVKISSTLAAIHAATSTTGGAPAVHNHVYSADEGAEADDEDGWVRRPAQQAPTRTGGETGFRTAQRTAAPPSITAQASGVNTGGGSTGIDVSPVKRASASSAGSDSRGSGGAVGLPAVQLQSVTALFDYEARSAAELSLSAGDEVRILAFATDTWAVAERGGRRGWVPRAYLDEESRQLGGRFAYDDYMDMSGRR